MATKTTAAYRKAHAVVHQGGQDKFPIDDAAHARSALRLLGKAKPPLTASQKSSVRARAAEFGVKSSKSSASAAKAGKTKKAK